MILRRRRRLRRRRVVHVRRRQIVRGRQLGRRPAIQPRPLVVRTIVRWYARRRLGRQIVRCTVARTRRLRRLCRNAILRCGRRLRGQIARFPAWSPLLRHSLGYIQISLSYCCRGGDRDVRDGKDDKDSSDDPVREHFRGLDGDQNER